MPFASQDYINYQRKCQREYSKRKREETEPLKNTIILKTAEDGNVIWKRYNKKNWRRY
jgi:hypothetical protein